MTTTEQPAILAPQLNIMPPMNPRQFCRKGIHSCTPALTLVFDNGGGTLTRLHWCAEHVFFAGPYRAGAIEVIDHHDPEEAAAAYFEAVAVDIDAPDDGSDASRQMVLDALRGEAETYDRDPALRAQIAMTDAQIRAWLSARGVPDRDLQLYVGQNRGRTEEEMDALYDAQHGSMA